MDLTTKCPQCQTVFQASLEQLQLRKGYVRCVHCAYIFDGYEAVVPNDPSAKAQGPNAPEVSDATERKVAHTPQPMRAPARQRTPARREFTVSDLAASSPDGERLPDTPLHTVGNTTAPQAGHEPIIGADASIDATPSGEPGLAGTGAAIDEPPGDGSIRADRAAAVPSVSVDDPYDADDGHTAPRWLWKILILAGLVVFLVQMVVVFRVQIAETLPGTRPALERLCSELGCRVAYPRQIDNIHIVQSALKAVRADDIEDEGGAKDGTDTTTEDAQAEAADLSDTDAEFLLEVTLRNDYGRAQEWPALTLELTDAVGARIARRHIQVHEYLPESVAGLPFPGKSEHEVVLPLTLRGLNVNGFKVRPYFP